MSKRKQHWENVYTDKSPLEVSWFQKEPTLSLQLINSADLNFNDAIIDVGGGASLLVDFLLAQGYHNISVLDISEKALESSRQRLADKADSVHWFAEDITTFNPPQPFKFWHDRAVFHFLTDVTDRKKYVEVLKQSLLSGGHLVIAAFAIGGPTQCSGLDIVQYDAIKLLDELGSGFELLEEFYELHLTPAEKEQKFNYFHFKKS